MSQGRTRFIHSNSQRAYLFVALVAVVWGVILWQQWRQAPVRGHMEAGARYMQSGQGWLAAIEWQRAVEIDPDNSEAWTLLSTYHLLGGQPEQARIALQRALKIEPASTTLQVQLAQCEVQLGNWESAQG